MKIKNADTERIDDEAKQLKTEMEQIKRELVELRKQGKYTTFVDELLMNVGPKIRMYKATWKKEDYNLIKDTFKQARDEIEKIKNSNDYTIPSGI